METKRIFQGDNVEQIAGYLAEEFRNRYEKVLNILKETSLDDLGDASSDYEWAMRHLKSDLDIILKETYDKVLEIINNRKANKSFYKRWALFPRRNKYIISISGNGKFFSRDEFNLAIGMNIEYIIDLRDLTVSKCSYLLSKQYPN